MTPNFKKFTVDELLEDASLSQMNTENDSKEYNDYQVVIDFLLDYKRTEESSEFFWSQKDVTDTEVEKND